MGRPKRASSRVASQLKALQKVGNITKALKPPKPKREPIPPPSASPPPAPVRGKPKPVAATPSFTVQVQAPPSKQPQNGDIVTDSTGQKWLYRTRLVDGQFRLEREPVASSPVWTAPKVEAPKAEAAKPEQTQPTSKRDNFPVWVREGRQPTREEWNAHQIARCNGPHRQHSGPASDERFDVFSYARRPPIGGGSFGPSY